MSKNRVLLLSLLALLALGLVYYYRYGGGNGYDWQEGWSKKAYRENNDQPYGTQIAHRLLQDYFPGKKCQDISKNLAAELPLDSSGNSNFVFIGEAMYHDSLSTRRLLDFAALGNTVLISSKTIPFDLMTFVYYEECEDAIWSDYGTSADTFGRPTLSEVPVMANPKLYYAKRNKPDTYQWSHIEPQFFCAELPQKPLGYLNDSLINFAEFPYGAGRFLLHTTPIAFSNFHLLQKDARGYAAGLLSYLKEGDIYWDAYSRVPERIARRRNERQSGFSRELPSEHPLTYMLQQKSLAWAWYLLLGMAGAYLLFRAKRRQRIIPVLPRNENSSYEFITTIANLHFREKNYQGLCMQDMRLFLAQIRERYGLMVQMNHQTHIPKTDDEFYIRLSQMSGVPERQVRDIFLKYASAVQFEPDENTMVDLHLAIERFFRKAK